MGILEDMQKIQYLQQMAQQGQGQSNAMQGILGQQQQQPGISMQAQRRPLEAGSLAAVQAAKHSLQMDENENRRALGRAMIQMASSMSGAPSYGHGLAGNLGAITAGFGPALQAYDTERDRIMQMNHAIQMQQKAEEMQARREEREMKKMAHDMDIAQRRLGIEQGYLGLAKQKREDEMEEHKLFTQEGGKIPLPRPGTQAFNYVQQYMDKKAERGEAAAENIHSIDEIAQILQDDPDITKDWSIISLAAQRKDPSIVRQKLNSWFIPEERRIRAEIMAKDLANLATGRVKGVSARAMNKMYEQWLKEGSADIGMLADSMKKVLQHDRENNSRVYQDWLDSDTAYREGYFERTKPIEIKEMSDEDIDKLFSVKSDKKNIGNNKNPFLGLSDAELDAKEAELRNNGGL